MPSGVPGTCLTGRKHRHEGFPYVVALLVRHFPTGNSQCRDSLPIYLRTNKRMLQSVWYSWHI